MKAEEIFLGILGIIVAYASSGGGSFGLFTTQNPPSEGGGKTMRRYQRGGKSAKHRKH
jgi:hypothetical protein